MTRRLVDDDELHEAVLWRVSGWPAHKLENLGTAVAAHLAAGGAIDEGDPACSALLARLVRPGDRRDGWSLLCALASLHGEAGGDDDLRWRAGFEVLAAYRQALRRAQRKTGDALDELLAHLVAEDPQASDAELWRRCEGLAAGRSCVRQAGPDVLRFRPDSDDPSTLRMIGRAEFARRVQAARVALGHQGVMPLVAKTQLQPVARGPALDDSCTTGARAPMETTP